MVIGRWLAAGVVVALFGAGCGGSGGSVAEEQTTLSVVMADDWANVAPVVDAVRTFEEANPGVRIDIRGVPFAQIPDVVTEAQATGRPVDVAHWHAFAAAARDLAEPLDDLWEGTLTDEEYVPGAVDDVTWAGKRYGVPLDVNALVMIVNRGILREEGLAMPEIATFGDLAELCAAVTEGERRCIAIPSSSWSTHGWIRANGGKPVTFTEDGTAQVRLDDDGAIGALEFLDGLIERGHAIPPFGRDVSTDAFSLFLSGGTAVHVSGSWDVVALEQAGIDYEVVPMPRGETGRTAGSSLGGSSLFVPVGSPNRELAFRFMVHLTKDESALRFAQEEGRLPARRRVYEHAAFDSPAYRTVVEQLATAVPEQLIAFPEAHAAFREAYEAVFTTSVSAADALAHAQEVAERSGVEPAG